MTTLLITITVAVISSYLTYYFSAKSRKDEAILKFKEQKYTALLVNLQGFMGRAASGEAKKVFLTNNTNLGFILLIALLKQLIICFN
jgi:hypothetical protein